MARNRRTFAGHGRFKGFRGGATNGAGGGDNANASGKKSNYVPMPRKKTKQEVDVQDLHFGFDSFTAGPERLGWLLTFGPTSVMDEGLHREVSAVEYYFLQQDGCKFKAMIKFRPYFYVYVKDRHFQEVESVLRRKYKDVIADIERIEMEDLDMPNHLALKNHYMRLSFYNVKELVAVRNELSPIVQHNKTKLEEVSGELILSCSQMNDGNNNAASSSGGGGGAAAAGGDPKRARHEDVFSHITDMREFDVPYHMRVSIDMEIRVGKWYNVSCCEGVCTFTQLPKLDTTLGRADPRVLAWDIECTKLPLKFPDAKIDSIYMISYMVDGAGYLIVDREIVAADIDDFEYNPKAEMPGPFKVFNEKNELALIRRFLDHIIELKPSVFVTYNGDYFDWPFLQQRCAIYGINLDEEIGFHEASTGEYACRFASHLDCLAWVKRDSYLPQGSHGLKAVTRAKLDYSPVEIDPELMLPFARENPHTMATYSVSDAVATYYLYMKYVHPFIFSLCNIIPMSPDDVLRKGSGTLCETLLMVQAFRGGIICPNKHQDDPMKSYKGHLLESETYIGGHVEALQSGVFRADIPLKFKLEKSAFDMLLENLDRDLRFAIEVEGGLQMENVLNYQEVREQVKTALLSLKETPKRMEVPSIIHLDVGAMYPNIILTNRLQPPAMVNDATCASCKYFDEHKQCRRELKWKWRGEYFPATGAEVRQLEGQILRDSDADDPNRLRLKGRLKTYCQKVYKKTHVTIQEEKTALICQRENSFYVDTVRDFKERRYEYKILQKTAFSALQKAEKEENAMAMADAEKQVILYESLQLAHKCILNSFYGYVMRKGARWYSMEMAGAVTLTGAKIIQNAKELVDRIGIPLELDTDGIWCALPQSFPSGLEFKHVDPKNPSVVRKYVVNYACEMLNASVHAEFTNHQYHSLVNPDAPNLKQQQQYAVRSECSILFEVDGPYRAMVLPAAKEEGKKLKKRYAVFHHNGSIAELKGFEMKRRGELSLIKTFQSQVFHKFLMGKDLQSCYASVAAVANEWLDVLDSHGSSLDDEQLLELISESSTMSKAMEEYGDRKSTAMTTAKRLGQFLGEAMLQDKGLACKYVICCKPAGAPVTERALPTAIFAADLAVRRQYLKRWTKDSSLADEQLSIRELLDWGYYRERLSFVIQKIITIPAALQGVRNPVERVPHPDWLQRQVASVSGTHRQSKVNAFFKKIDENDVVDIEDLESSSRNRFKGLPTVVSNRRDNVADSDGDDDGNLTMHDAAAAAPPPPPVAADSNNNNNNNNNNSTENGRISPPPGDFDEWLAKNKKIWLQRAEERRKAQEISHNNGIAPTSSNNRRLLGKSGLGSFLRGQGDVIASKPWQILQIRETNTKGLYSLWLLLPDKSMSRVTLNVKRIFYVNRRNADMEHGARSAKKLPFDKPSHYLTEHMVEEQDFQSYSKQLSLSIGDCDVEGVYETQVSLLFRSLVTIGCCCTVDPKSNLAARIRRDNRVPLEVQIEDLRFQNTVVAPYLTDNDVCKQGVLFYSHHDKRGLFGLKLPNGTVHGIFVKPFKDWTSQPQFKRIISQMAGADSNLLNLDFKVSTETTVEKACQRVNQLLLEAFSKQKEGCTMLVKMSTTNLDDLTGMIPMLQHYPVLTIPTDAAINNYPALGWETVAAAAFVRQMVGVDETFQTYLRLSRYAHVPICNMESDDISVMLLDVLYARNLAAANLVWWASPSSLPDLGGSESLDDFQPPEDLNAELNFPGCYRGYCASLDIGLLAVAAITHKKELDDSAMLLSSAAPATQGGDGMFPLVETLIDETTAVADAFKIVEKMVIGWGQDVVRGRNNIADWMQSHLASWLSSPQSLFRTSLLQREVWRWMGKLFRLLLGKMKELGANIIHASMSRIIVSTNKTSLESTRAYLTYLVETLRHDNVFAFLNLSPLEIWSTLIFVDRFNYGGLLVWSSENEQRMQQLRVNGEEEEQEGGNEDDDENNAVVKLSDANPQIVCHWDIAAHLPPTLQKWFSIVVEEFMTYPLRYRNYLTNKDSGLLMDDDDMSMSDEEDRFDDDMDEASDDGDDFGSKAVSRAGRSTISAAQQSQASKRSVSIVADDFTLVEQPPVVTDPNDLAALERKFIQDLFSEKTGEEETKEKRRELRKQRNARVIRPKSIFRSLIERFENLRENLEFTRMPAPAYTLTNPRLEFVKVICYVLGLDEAAAEPVAKMKKSLLRMLNVREFATIAQFTKISRSLVVPNYFCSMCFSLKDLDVCRDASLVHGHWNCESCDHVIEKSKIETRIVEECQRLARFHQQQDVRCERCGSVPHSTMALTCRCSGKFKMSHSQQKMKEKLETMLQVAEYYSMPLLLETVRWALQTEDIAAPNNPDTAAT